LPRNQEFFWPFFRKSSPDASGEYVADIGHESLARFVRVRLDGHECLHFRECRVFGEKPDAATRARLIDVDARALRIRRAVPEGRKGRVIRFGGFDVFIDEENYSEDIRLAMTSGEYENRERRLVREFVAPGDRVLEVGGAIGVVAMTAASIVGSENVVTFDANPDIVADAKENFRRNDLGGVSARCGALVNRRKFQRDSFVAFFIRGSFWASSLKGPRHAPGVEKVVEIPTFCLEDEIARHRANVLICDIEGGEVDLLMDADLTGIRLILMEIHYFATGEKAADDMVRKLILDGFTIDLVASGGGVLALRR